MQYEVEETRGGSSRSVVAFWLAAGRRLVAAAVPVVGGPTADWHRAESVCPGSTLIDELRCEAVVPRLRGAVVHVCAQSSPRHCGRMET